MKVILKFLRTKFSFSWRDCHARLVENNNSLKKERQVCYVEFAMISNSSPSEMFKERLKSARELRGYSQSKLAELARMPPSSIAHFEAGARKPSFDNLTRLANALSVTTDYLVGRVDKPDLAEAGDPLFKDVAKLSGGDRDLITSFAKMLADRSAQSKKE
jgi:transcriptional regulator with XRE-family HTH domain